MHVVSDQVWGENASRSYVLTKYAINLYPSFPHTHVLYNWYFRGRCNCCRGIWLSQFSLVCPWDTLCMGTKSSYSSCRLPWWWHEPYDVFDYYGSWTSSSSIHTPSSCYGKLENQGRSHQVVCYICSREGIHSPDHPSQGGPLAYSISNPVALVLGFPLSHKSLFPMKVGTTVPLAQGQEQGQEWMWTNLKPPASNPPREWFSWLGTWQPYK